MLRIIHFAPAWVHMTAVSLHDMTLTITQLHFLGILHEAGHGMYDQGLRTDWYGLPPGSYMSLGIHESQSRMWENLVGRSHAFWQHFFPAAQAAFPTALQAVTLDDFYFAINDVRPSLIRVEADEATYNLHIIVRFELEQALIAGNLSVADLPDAWDDKYQQLPGNSFLQPGGWCIARYPLERRPDRLFSYLLPGESLRFATV